MEWIWIILGAILVIVGIAGCIVPIIPGPPISYGGLLLLQLTNAKPLESRTMIIWLLVTIAVTALDYIVPIWGTKKYGGTKRGVWGSTIGLFVGIFFFPPIGIILGPFLGAIVGELSAGQNSNTAFRAGFGSFIGLLTGTILKIVASGWMAYLFFTNL